MPRPKRESISSVTVEDCSEPRRSACAAASEISLRRTSIEHVVVHDASAAQRTVAASSPMVEQRRSTRQSDADIEADMAVADATVSCWDRRSSSMLQTMHDQ